MRGEKRSKQFSIHTVYNHSSRGLLLCMYNVHHHRKPHGLYCAALLASAGCLGLSTRRLCVQLILSQIAHYFMWHVTISWIPKYSYTFECTLFSCCKIVTDNIGWLAEWFPNWTSMPNLAALQPTQTNLIHHDISILQILNLRSGILKPRKKRDLGFRGQSRI